MMDGKMFKTASGFNSYEIYDAENDHIFIFADVLTKKFGFQMNTAPMVGLDGVYWDASKLGVKLTAGWDVWSGAFIFAHCPKGDEYVKEIAEYLIASNALL